MKKDDFGALGRGFEAAAAAESIHTHAPSHHANLTTKAASVEEGPVGGLSLGHIAPIASGRRRSGTRMENGPACPLSNGPQRSRNSFDCAKPQFEKSQQVKLNTDLPHLHLIPTKGNKNAEIINSGPKMVFYCNGPMPLPLDTNKGRINGGGVPSAALVASSSPVTNGF